jgi:hypothetical protein
MAQASGLTCRQAQKLMQMLLDRRWTRPVPPRLQDHFEECECCQSFLTLFDYQPASPARGPAPDFSNRVIASLKQQGFRKHRLVRQTLFASAAAILISLFGWYLRSSNLTSAPPRNVPDLWPALISARQQIERVPEHWQNMQPPSLDLFAALPEFELPIPSDPLTGTMPSVRALGTTLQAAIEPIETPAKEAYQKVKMIMHDPNVKKWLDNVTNGSM